MKIVSLETTPFLAFPSITTAPGGRGVHRIALPALLGTAEDLPDGIDALIAASDLQYYDDRLDLPPADRRLVGHSIAEQLEGLARAGLLPSPDRTGVMLCGDLYAVPELNRRGGLGDVEQVWMAFARRFSWVVGVAGNHDSFAGRIAFDRVFDGKPNVHPLHGATCEVGGTRIAGLSGVVGAEDKPWRNTPDETTDTLKTVLDDRPDVLLLHEGPAAPEVGGRGHAVVRDALDHAPAPLLVISGHAHWKTPLGQLGPDLQVLNVDSRVVVLLRPELFDGFAANFG